MKKFVALLLAVVMCVAMMAGCGKAPAATEAPAAPAEADPAQTAEPAAEPIELRFLTYDAGKNANDEYIRQIQVDAFNAANPDIHVTLEFQCENNSVEYLQKLDLLTMSNYEYDICALPSYQNYAERAVKGVFAPVDDMILADEGKTYDEVYSYTAAVDGVNYALPYYPSIYYVLINKDMLDAAGLETPALDWTWDDYRDYAVAMTSGEGANKVYGSYMHTWCEYRREALFGTKMDNPYVNPDGTSNMADPVFKEWLEYIKGMENDGCQIPYRDATATSMAYRDVFFSGKAAMILTGSWIITDIKNTDSFPHTFQTVFAPMPRWKDSPEGRCEGSATYNAINANSKNKEAAYRFLKFVSNEGAALVGEFSTRAGADNSVTLAADIEGFENLIDGASLSAIWNNPKLQANFVASFPETFAELDDVYHTESEKYMLDAQDIDTTVKNIADKGAAILG